VQQHAAHEQHDVRVDRNKNVPPRTQLEPFLVFCANAA
jgi:hypothetical protein